MKNLLRFFVICFMLVFVGNVVAENVSVPESNWSLKVFLYQTVPLDQEAIVQNGKGLQLSLYNNSLAPFFLYLLRDTNQVRFVGQGGPDVNFWSLGIGMEHKLGKYLTLAVDVGWYEPKFDEMGKPQDYYSSPFAEGLCRYLNNFLMPTNQGQPYIPNWEYYSLEYKGGFGGKLSLEFDYPINESFTFEIKVGYKYLKVQEHVLGADYDGGYARLGEAGCWTIRYDRDFSAFMIGGVLSYKF